MATRGDCTRTPCPSSGCLLRRDHLRRRAIHSPRRCRVRAAEGTAWNQEHVRRSARGVAGDRSDPVARTHCRLHGLSMEVAFGHVSVLRRHRVSRPPPDRSELAPTPRHAGLRRSSPERDVVRSCATRAVRRGRPSRVDRPGPRPCSVEVQGRGRLIRHDLRGFGRGAAARRASRGSASKAEWRGRLPGETTRQDRAPRSSRQSPGQRTPRS